MTGEDCRLCGAPLDDASGVALECPDTGAVAYACEDCADRG